MRSTATALLLLLASLATLVHIAAAQPPPVLRYTLDYNSTSMTPSHGRASSLHVRGILVAYLVEAKPPLYTYQYRVIASSVELKGFPGNDTEAEQKIIETLSQPRNVTIDAATCRVVGGRLDLPPYCSPEALVKHPIPNATITRRDGRIVVEAVVGNTRIHAVYSEKGLLLEAELVTQAPGEQEILTLKLLEAQQYKGTPDYARATLVAVLAAVSAGALTWMILRRRKRG